MPFKGIENKNNAYIVKDCMKFFCESLKNHTIKITSSKKKKNEVTHKWIAEIISKFKNLLYLSRKVRK